MISPLPCRKSRLLAGPLAGGLGILLTTVSCSGGPVARVTGGARPLFDAGEVVAMPATPSRGASSEFWTGWGDGRAELSAYRITTPRYGEPREGELVLIYVTEPHDRRTWIKDDAVDEPHRVEVLKLNASLKFMTGVYPYSVLTSVFAPVDAYFEERFQPVKISMSAQEWCGHVFHELWAGRSGFRALRLSYFAEEGERVRDQETGGGVLYEDALLIQLRELDGPFAGGGDWSGRIVPGLWESRRGHTTLEPVAATIERGSGEREGAPVTRFVISYGSFSRTVEVERDPPRRILGWTTSDGEDVRLVGSRRLAYWRLNGTEDPDLRATLGLDPHGSVPPPGTPPPAGEGGT